MYTATNVSRSVRPKEGECSPEYATSLKLVTGQDALPTQCLFTGTAEQSSKGWHAAHGCLAAVRQRRCPFAKTKVQRAGGIQKGTAGREDIASVISAISQMLVNTFDGRQLGASRPCSSGGISVMCKLACICAVCSFLHAPPVGWSFVQIRWPGEGLGYGLLAPFLVCRFAR